MAGAPTVGRSDGASRSAPTIPARCMHDGRPYRRGQAAVRGRVQVRVAGPSVRAGTVARRRGATRLTGRGRVVVVAVVAALLLAAFSIGRVSAVAHAARSAPGLQHVTVRPGETLWGVAEQVAPDNDPRVTVARLMQLNHLTSAAVQAGQSLLVPRR